jgi:sec-independent protein translocase protein TatB
VAVVLGRLALLSEREAASVAAAFRRIYDDYMNLGFSEMVFLFILALLIFGPKKLPEVGRQIGRFMNEFKRASNEFKAQIESEINSLESVVQPQILPPLHAPLNSLASRIFNPPPAARLEADEAAAAPAAENTDISEPSHSPKVAPDA